MSLVIRFITGALRGAGRPDLEKWISDLPGAIGEEFGKLLHNNIPESGALTDEGEKRIEDWLRTHEMAAGQVLAGLLNALETSVSEGDSLIPGYLGVLNPIVDVIREISRPLVLRGFIHNAECLSYWHCDFTGPFQPTNFQNDPDRDVIYCSNTQPPQIYILEAATEERLKELNLRIRKAHNHQLNAEEYRGKPRISTIREFEIELQAGNELDDLLGRGGTIETIPAGAPGLLELLSSLPVALETQRLPKAQLKETLAAIRQLTS